MTSFRFYWVPVVNLGDTVKVVVAANEEEPQVLALLPKATGYLTLPYGYERYVLKTNGCDIVPGEVKLVTVDGSSVTEVITLPGVKLVFPGPKTEVVFDLPTPIIDDDEETDLAVGGCYV